MNGRRECLSWRAQILSLESVNAAYLVRPRHSISSNVPFPTAKTREALRLIQVHFPSKQRLLRPFSRDCIGKDFSDQAQSRHGFVGPIAIDTHRSEGNCTDEEPTDTDRDAQHCLGYDPASELLFLRSLLWNIIRNARPFDRIPSEQLLRDPRGLI